MAVTELAARLVKDADLSLFGISSSDQPTRSRYPKAFNPQALRVWDEVLESNAYKTFRQKTPETQKLWSFAIQQFLRECSLSNTYPFSGSHDFEGTARAFLASSRRKLVAFFEAQGFFKHLRVTNVSRSTSFTAQNFVVECTANLKPIEDPTFEAWLMRLPEPAFVKKQDGTLSRNVHAHIEVFYRVTHKGAVIGYKVFCHTPLRLINGKIASRRKMQEYVDREFWRPLIKEVPVSGIPANRLF